MLSTGAFNALLKTLEEPPDHAKFIFATTEIRKVPITVLSRCQRFDLRRVEAGELVTHLSSICDKENAKVSQDGLGLIARAAEGSVRDALSLLDQAIVQRSAEMDEVSMEQVRDMLGLADRVRVLDLFALAASGDAAGALGELRSQYDHGADPIVVMRDMLDICHEVSRAKALGEAAGFDAAPDQIDRLRALADSLTMGQVTRLWQMLLKAHADVKMAPTPLAAAEMALLRMTVAAELPPPEWAAKLLETPGATVETPSTPKPPSGGGTTGGAMMASASTAQAQAAPAPQMQAAPAGDGPNLTSLKAVSEYAFANGQKALSSDIERSMRLIHFSVGTIEFAPTRNAPPLLANNLKAFLKDATQSDWQVVVNTQETGAETLRDQAQAAKAAQQEADKNHPDIAAAMAAFPGARLVEIRSRKTTSDNIIEGNFNPNKT